MPNALAYAALYLWPVVVYVLFRTLRQDLAIATAIIGGYLLLPTQVGIDLPAVPALTKEAVPILAVGLMLLFGVRPSSAGQEPAATAAKGRARGAVWSGTLVAVMVFISPLVTTLTNTDPILDGIVVLPAMRLYDAGAIIATSLVLVLPYLIARRFFVTTESHVALLKVLVIGMLVYCLPILFELRMSPQLNIMFYGFFPHDFAQHIRPGGFRPLVFLSHGLWLAIILAMAVLAALALWRQRNRDGMRSGQWAFAALALLIVLAISNNLGALAIAVLLLPVALFLGVRSQLLIAGIVAGTVLLYPMVRVSQIIPLDRIVAAAAWISPDRAQSLQFRLDNEDALAEHASERPLAGWGTWGRNLLHDPFTGRETSVTDGAWIITIGSFGWLGYIAQFGLLGLPILLMAIRRRSLDIAPATAGLALVMAANLLDLIPNATLTPVTWLIGGALAGRYAFGHQADTVPVTAPPPTPSRSWALVTDRPDTPAKAQPPEDRQNRGRRQRTPA